jgi:hypothetical protein
VGDKRHGLGQHACPAWPANWELAVGLNADRTDSDCDGVSDSVEYPLASLPVSDPRQNTCAGNSVDIYAVAATARTNAKAQFRLRNYTAATRKIVFRVFDPNGAAHNVALNPGAAVCVPDDPTNQIENATNWTCRLDLAPGAAGNEAVSLDFGACNAGNTLTARIQILSRDSYTVNNDVTVNVCP